MVDTSRMWDKVRLPVTKHPMCAPRNGEHRGFADLNKPDS